MFAFNKMITKSWIRVVVVKSVAFNALSIKHKIRLDIKSSAVIKGEKQIVNTLPLQISDFQGSLALCLAKWPSFRFTVTKVLKSTICGSLSSVQWDIPRNASPSVPNYELR